MPHCLDLEEGAQSRGARRSCEVRNSLGHVDTFHGLGRSLFERFPQLCIGAGEIERVDVCMGCEVWSHFGDLSGQDVDHSCRYVGGRDDLSEGDRDAGILVGSDYHARIAPGDHWRQHRYQAQQRRSGWRKNSDNAGRFGSGV